MWRLWNKLFGWDYIYFDMNFFSGVRRIRKTSAGIPYFNRGEYITWLYFIKDPSVVNWLTCHPDKYMK